MSEVQIYTQGLCYASACAPSSMSGEEVVSEVRQTSPSGTEGNWKLSSSAAFRGGQPNPCPCEHDDTRKHWLLEA